MKRFIASAVCLLLGSIANAQDAVKVRAEWESAALPALLAVHVQVPDGFYLYADKFSVTAAAVTLRAANLPTPKSKHDPYTDKTVAVYDQSFTATYAVEPAGAPVEPVRVAFQACDASLCYLPATRMVAVEQASEPSVPSTDGSAVVLAAPPTEGGISGFRLAGSANGYLNSREFIAFLDRSGRAEQETAVNAFARRGVWLSCLLILLGGLALNLTPCVLPMIPVNLAIIGAGAAAGSRKRGFLLGSAYGLGIALVYGVLGLLVVLAGVKFGTLNASPWFNLGIAGIFVVLALGLFDVLHIDLSRFQGSVGSGTGEARPGRVWTAFLLGGIAALLAGACVAPVVIGVLLLATDLYARGQQAGLLLPFLLGLGMALPWPLAGAGMSVLPKPGRWMTRVKAAFGVVILLAALWYGHLGVSLLRARAGGGADETVAAQQAAGWLTSIDEGFAQARAQNKPVLVDFWASWCKSCLHMEKTTFHDPAVRERLDGFVKVKVRAEDPSAPETAAVLNRFGVLGLPTYVVLLPNASGPAPAAQP